MRSHWLWILFMLPLAACGLTDGATRIAYAIESGVSALDAAEGSRHELVGITPAQGGECVGPYKAQFDQVGALIVWCFDATGAIKSSHSTSYHARFVDTAQTFIVDKTAGSTLTLELQRRGGRAVVVDVR